MPHLHTTCHCDGPPHLYSPRWCREGRGDDGKEIDPFFNHRNIAERATMPTQEERARQKEREEELRKRIGARTSAALSAAGLSAAEFPKPAREPISNVLWDRFTIDWSSDRITFRTRGGSGGKVTMDLNALRDHVDEMTTREWNQISQAVSDGSRGPGLAERIAATHYKEFEDYFDGSIGGDPSERRTTSDLFGRLVKADKNSGSAVFRKGEVETELNVDIVVETAKALIVVGAISSGTLTDILKSHGVVTVPPPPPPTTPEQALRIIEQAVFNSPDSFKASGEWIAKTTNVITKAAHDKEGEAEE